MEVPRVEVPATFRVSDAKVPGTFNAYMKVPKAFRAIRSVSPQG
jgi:hypothetical protein